MERSQPSNGRAWQPRLALALAFAVIGCSNAAPTATHTAAPSAVPSSATHGPITLALVHGLLVDGTGAPPIADGVVLISGDRIVAAGPSDQVKAAGAGRTIDVKGAAILPGFINAHVHRGFDRANLKAWAEGGVTTVRDEGASIGQVANLKTTRAELAQDPHYARLVSAGVMLAVPGGYGDRFVSSPEEAKAAVIDQLASGADAAKVSIEDGYAGTTGLPKMTPEELAAVVETAHGHGIPVSGHITQARYLQPLLDAGVDDVAHVPYDSLPEPAVRQMVADDVYLVPTFTVFRNYGAPVDGCVANVKQVLAAGGHVALGNDYGGGPGSFELGVPMYEVEMLAKAGMTPMEVVQAATKNAAHVLNLDREIGTLEAGKAADLLVVGANPLDDLGALRDVRLVVHAGTVIRSDIGE